MKRLYASLDELQSSGEDVVRDLRKEINNAELEYIKEDVYPEIIKLLGQRLKNIRCQIDMSLQYNGKDNIDYSYCTSNSGLLFRDSESIASTDPTEAEKEQHAPETAHIPAQTTEAKRNPHGKTPAVYGTSVESPSYKSKAEEPTKDATYYADAFEKMRRAVIGGYKTPHKAILLIAIFNNIRKGLILNEKIEFSEELKRSFKTTWDYYIPPQSPFTCRPANPFIHLSSDGFYHLKLIKPININISWSESSVMNVCEYATIDKELFDIVRNTDHYFSFRKQLERMFDLTPYTQGVTKPQKGGFEPKRDVHKRKRNKSDDFIEYLTSTENNKRAKYPLSTAKAYASTLNQYIFKSAAKKIAGCDSVFDTTDLNALYNILAKTKEEYLTGMTRYKNVTAIELYIKYVKEKQ